MRPLGNVRPPVSPRSWRDVVLERREGQGLPFEEQNGKQERERARVCESADGSTTAGKPRVRYAGTAEWRALGDLEMPPTAGLAVPGTCH